MSSDAIIEGLKQGNAIEMELVKQFKEGLDSIADGMQRECFNRSDALSELREKLEVERAKDHGHITSEQRDTLAALLKVNVLKCQKAFAHNKEKCDKAIDDVNNARYADKEAYNKANSKSQEEKRSLNKLADIINGSQHGPAANGLREVTSIWEERKALLDNEALRIDKRWIQRINAMHDETRKMTEAAMEEIRMLIAIGEAAGIDLYQA